jgi:TRAP-type C4-dicarboxylate transport system permease small subunit
VAVSMGLEVPSSGGRGRPGWLHVVDRVLRVIEWLFETIALVALATIMVNTVVNAFTRHVYDSPIPGSLNVTLLYLMPALVFLSLGRVQAMNSHIAATLFVDRLGNVGQRAAKVAVTVVIVAVSAMMLNGSAGELRQIWGATLGGSPELPLGPSWIFVPLGIAAIVLRATWQLLILAVVPDDPGIRQAPDAPAEVGGVDHA